MAQTSILTGRRILIAAEYIDHGGTRTYFRDLVKFYARNGAEIVAVTTHEQPDYQMSALFNALGQVLITYSAAAAQFSGQRKGGPPATWGMRQYLREKQLFENLADHFEIDQVVLSVGTSGLFLSAAHARPAPIFIAHGYPHGIRQQILGRRVLGRRLPEDLTIVTVSDFSARLFDRAWGLPRSEIGTMTVYSTCGEVLPRRGQEATENLVLTAALLDPYKNPLDWIAIADRVSHEFGEEPKPCFTWIGDGPALDDARQAARRANSSPVFPGWIDDVGTYYNRARVYLHTSSIESLGLSVVDALRYGLPCVVSDSGGLPEVIEHGVSGFVYPTGNIEAASFYVTQLLRDRDLWDQQSAAARQRYKARFSVASWTEGLLRAHSRAVSGDEAH